MTGKVLKIERKILLVINPRSKGEMETEIWINDYEQDDNCLIEIFEEF